MYRVSLMFPVGQEVKFWFLQATNESPDVLIDQFKREPAKGVVKKMLYLIKNFLKWKWYNA